MLSVNNQVSHLNTFPQDKKTELPKQPSCGNKHDTLIKIFDFLEKHRSDGVVLPKPEGVPSKIVTTFLKETAPHFFHCWQQLKDIYGDSNPNFFEDSRVMPLITKAQEAIQQAFEHFALPETMEAWLDSQEYYMVRSTGSEDNKKTANAGGNKSCHYVQREEITAKMGEVIASYIDKRSLMNRIRAGENPFDSLPELSVTVQQMIGEPIGGEKDPSKIPISVVLFTNEPLYVGNEPFRIMKLSATYGQGEGVVGNRGILTDTAFVLQSINNPDELYIWYDSRDKPERLAPIQTPEGVKLEPIANPEELVHRKALSPEMIKRLFKEGLKMERLFEGPSDMEIVIKEEKIYIVQARPVNRILSLPSYVDLDASTLKNPTQAKVLVPGKSTALVIDDAEQVLVEDTLEKASDALKEKHKLVIAREDEPINSHYIIQMTEQNIPCFHHPDGMQTLISELQHGKPLAVCTQQGVTALIEDPSQVIIKEGYITHPAPLSCPLDYNAWRKNRQGIPKDVYTLLKQIRLEQNKKVALKAFEELAMVPLLKDLPKRISYRPLAVLAEEMQQRVHETLRELGQVLVISENRLEILFYAKALETLLWGEGYSVIRLEALSEALSSYEQKLDGKEASLAAESLIEPLMPETGQAWVEFLVAVEKNHSPEDSKALKQLLACIGDVRPLWLTFFFDRARKKTSHSHELLNVLLKGFDPQSQAFVNELRRLEKTVDRFKSDLFADTNAQQFAFAQLKELINKFEDSETLKAFASSSPLAKIIALQILAKAVALYDTSVKTMKLNTPLATKAPLFQEMLGPFLSLLNSISLKLIGEGKFPYQGLTMQAYLNRIKAIIEQPIDFSSLEALNRAINASQGFAVLAAMYGSGAEFSRHEPATLEDCFTLIHQNLLACISFLLAKNINFEDMTPPALFQETQAQLQSFRQTQLLGVEQGVEQFILKYNAPLRNHSSTFQLTYKEGQVSLSVQLLGQARERWTQTNQYLQMLDALGFQLLAKKPYQRGDVLNFTYCCNTKEQFAHVLNIVDVAYEFSLDMDIDRLTRDIIARISRTWTTKSEQNEAYEKAAALAEQFIRSSNTLSWPNDWTHLLHSFIDHDKVLEKITAIAVNLASAPSATVKSTSVYLLKQLISRGHALKEAPAIVDKFFRYEDCQIRLLAAELLNALVETGESIDQATFYAQEKLDDNADDLFYALLHLWEKLSITTAVDPLGEDLSQKEKLNALLYAYCHMSNQSNAELSTRILVRFTKDGDPLIRRRLAQVLTLLVGQGHAPWDVLSLARLYSQDPDVLVRQETTHLLEKLTTQGKEIDQILLIVEVLAQDKDLNVKLFLCDVLEKIIQIAPNKVKIMEIIDLLIDNSNSTIQLRALKAVEQIVQKNQFLKEALAIAFKLREDAEVTMDLNFLSLLTELIKQDFEYDRIAVLLESFASNPDVVVIDRLLYLFEIVISKGHGFKQSFSAVQKIVASPRSFTHPVAIRFLQKLVEKNYAIEEITSFVEQLLESSDSFVKNESYMLLETIIQKYFSPEESIAFCLRIYLAHPDEARAKYIGLTSLSTLIRQEKACDKIAQAAEEMLPLGLRSLGFNLLEELIKQRQATEEVSRITNKLLEADKLATRLKAKRLLSLATETVQEKSTLEDISEQIASQHRGNI